jgi:hypothetical protein
MFLHDSGGITHILFNMFALWMFGSTLEKLWGSQRFLIFYLICGLGAGLVQMGALFTEQGNTPESSTTYAKFGPGFTNKNYVDPNAEDPFLIYARGNVPLDTTIGPKQPSLLDINGSPFMFGEKGIRTPPNYLDNNEMRVEIKLNDPEADAAKIQNNKLSNAENCVMKI